jgi:hypothetical protein
VKNYEEDNEKKFEIQGIESVVAGPSKIGASTPHDFSARNLTAYGGLLPVDTMLENLGFHLDRGNAHDSAADTGDSRVPVRAGHGAGAVCGVFTAASSALCGARRCRRGF